MNRLPGLPRTGFEPARLAALPPQSSASASSATWALFGTDYIRWKVAVEMELRLQPDAVSRERVELLCYIPRSLTVRKPIE